MYNKILLPTDGSEVAENAAEHAFLLGSKNGAQIIVLNVVETPRFRGIRSEDKDELMNRFRDEGQKSFDRIKGRMKSRAGEKCEQDIKLDFRFLEGSPADEILKTIEKENIDLVVMGTSGKRGINRFLLGSVTENTMRSARCPVLVVR
ncbi:universal stress protein [Methanobacterium sp. ACI-7]|uniref:universal stress protein n=1 Tax=unclassified Methanobacterium TaxID=2627676 RepID=UPI0039C164B1